MTIRKTVEVWACENCGKHLASESTTCTCQPKTSTDKKAFCRGCYNDEYNYGLGGAKQCWGVGSMTVISRKRVHINDVPPWKHEPEQLPDCYRKPQYVFVDADTTC